MVGEAAIDARRAAVLLELQPGGEELGIHRLGTTEPDDVDRCAPRAREEPGEHAAATRVVAVGAAPGAGEGLLSDILRGSRVAHDAQREPVDTLLEAAHEGRRGFTVPIGQPGQECLVGGAHTQLYESSALSGLPRNPFGGFTS